MSRMCLSMGSWEVGKLGSWEPTSSIVLLALDAVTSLVISSLLSENILDVGYLIVSNEQ